MSRMAPKVWATKDREHVGMQLEENAKSLGYILFDGATAEKPVPDVAEYRAQLNEEVSFSGSAAQ
jgi:hypothetical protein